MQPTTSNPPPDDGCDGETGQRVPPGDPGALHSALNAYLASRALRSDHGAAARAYVVENFEAKVVSSRIHESYRLLLRSVPRLHRRSRGIGYAMKRGLDIFGAGIGLLVLQPILALLAFLIHRKLGGPVLFRQNRPGRHGKAFTILKFRTMTDERDRHGKLLADEQRLPRFGQVLRSTSLDELPELWNVLRGEMSLVGPRPLLTKYLDRYSPEQARRHDMKPGITGWAQVNGRNSSSWNTKLAHDVWYVDHWSFLLDIRVLFRTVATILRRDGIEHDDHVTMPEFEGTAGGNA